MILSLHIDKEAPGQYHARVTDGVSTLADFQIQSISHAIRDAVLAHPKAMAFHIWYEHVSIGTTLPLAMRHDAGTLAQRLMTLHGQVR